MKYCKFCGSKVEDGGSFCTHCGKHVEDEGSINININNSNTNSVAGKTKNKWIAFFLCLFLGGIGAHKFYEGKPVLGIIYALFCWTYIPVFVSIIDLIVILTKPTEYNV